MRTITRALIMGSLSLVTWCTPLTADGGLLRLSEKKGGYQITVLTAPTPFRAGPVDVSVLVQNSSTGELISDAGVTVRMSKAGRSALEYPATREAATNKLFHAAQFVLPEPGRWEMQVKVEGWRGRAVVDSAVEAADPLPRWQTLLLWMGWPALVIALFGIHQVLVQRASCRAGPTVRVG